MSVETLQRLHGRYTDLSNRFRSGWAFHQFAASLRRIFPGGSELDHAAEFQTAYASLKSISSRLDAEDPGVLDQELQSVGETLKRLTAALADEDSKVSPQAVRHFFQRVKNEDDKVLTQLVKFHVYAAGASGWTEDRLDKLDFLTTRVCEEHDPASDRYVLVERRRVREMASGLWSLVNAPEPPDEEVSSLVADLRTLRQSVAAAETLDELNERRLVERYRELKHGLGPRYLHPKLLHEVLDTNLAFKNLIRQLYSVEERRITADYQRVFDLERDAVVDGELDRELRSFREEVEGFERQLQGEELKLKDLAHLRERIRSLSVRLATEETATAAPPTPPARGGEAPAGDEVLAEAVARLDEALAKVDAELPARRAVLASDLYALRLEARELEAHRRLREGSGTVGGELDQTIVEAAALRIEINRQVEELRALLDDTAVTGEAAVFGRSRHILRLAGGYVARLEAAVEQALLHGDVVEAQALTVLRMRLVRDHAGAWLLAVRPLLNA